jgi:hypothetical protein
MAEKRTHENSCPESLYPKQLLENRTFPTYDYFELEKQYVEQQQSINKTKKTLVTIALDIDREKTDQRNFEEHYLKGLQKICKTPHDLIIFMDKKYEDEIRSYREGKNLKIIPFDIELLRSYDIYDKVKKIVTSEQWSNQSEWMKDSIIRSPDYVFLTLLKPHLLLKCMNEGHVDTQEIFWIDSGVFNSYRMPFAMDDYNLDVIKEDSFFITSFPYFPQTEIHGYNVEGYKKLCGFVPQKVYRASFFGGSRDKVKRVFDRYKRFLLDSIGNGFVGTEESIFSAVCHENPDVTEFPMTCGDVRQFFDTLLM